MDSNRDDYEEWSEISRPFKVDIPSPTTSPTKLSTSKPVKLPKPKANIFRKPSFASKKPSSPSPTTEKKQRPLPPSPGKSFRLQKPEDPDLEVQVLAKAITEDTKKESCERDACQRQFDIVCKRCKQFLCYRCGKTECTEEKKHDIQDVEDCLAGHKTHYEIWRAGRKNQTMIVDQEMRAVSLAIKKHGQTLANSPLSTIATSTKDTIGVLKEHLQKLEKMSEEVKTIGVMLEFHDLHIKELSDVAFIKLVGEMKIINIRAPKFNLGTYDTMVVRTCEHVTMTPDGNGVLVSTNDSVELFNATSSHSVGSVVLGGHVAGFHSDNNMVYVAIDMGSCGDKIIVFDQQFVQVRNWMTEVKVCDLTVNHDKVYLATTDNKLHVFSTHGTPLYEITEGAGTRLASHPLPNIILVTSHEHDRVCAIDGESKKVMWSAEVDKPWGVAIDEYEAVWVWSEFNQGLTIFDDKGNQKQEIEHQKLTGIGDVNSICVKNGKLWVAFEGGMHRFQIGYG